MLDIAPDLEILDMPLSPGKLFDLLQVAESADTAEDDAEGGGA